MFRRDVFTAPVYNELGDLVVEGSELDADCETQAGVVREVAESAFRIAVKGASTHITVGLPYAAGWEPFLCLDEGEAQERPADADPDGEYLSEEAAGLLMELWEAVEKMCDEPPSLGNYFTVVGAEGRLRAAVEGAK